MLYFMLVTMFLNDPTLYTQAQDQSVLRVIPSFIRQSDSVYLSCEASWTSKSYCDFCIYHPHCVWNRSKTCRLTLSGNDLIAQSGHSGIVEIILQCVSAFYDNEHPAYSLPTPVTILGPPQLLVSPKVISETDRVHLTCQTPQSPLVSQCVFSVQGEQIKRSKSCLLKRHATDLLPWSGLRQSTQISLSCYYTVKKEESSNSVLSDSSKAVFVTLTVETEESTPHPSTQPTQPTSVISEKPTTAHPSSNPAKTTSNTLAVNTKTSSTSHLKSKPAKTTSVTLIERRGQSSTSGLSSDPTELISVIVGPEGIWTEVVTVVGVSMFVVILVTSIFCLRKRRCAVKRIQTDTSPATHVNLPGIGFRSTDISPGVMSDEEVQLSSMVAFSELMVTQDANQSASDMNNVYSSICDIPNATSKEECAYSVIKNCSSNQENDIYSLLQ